MALQNFVPAQRLAQLQLRHRQAFHVATASIELSQETLSVAFLL